MAEIPKRKSPGGSSGDLRAVSVGDLALIDSHNITSVTDNGTGDFTIGFAKAADLGKLVCLPMPPTSSTLKAVIAPDFGCIRVVFDGEEPEIVGLRID